MLETIYLECKKTKTAQVHLKWYQEDMLTNHIYGNKSNSVKKIEKQIIPNMMNLLWGNVNVKTVLINIHQDFTMVKNVAWTTMDVFLKSLYI